MPNDVFHYPPDLFELLVQAIPLLNKSKPSVLLFFKGAGVDEAIYSDIEAELRLDRHSINKFDMVRSVLERINVNSQKFLRERREIIKRVTEFESFNACWPDDQLKAKGLVSEIQKVVNVKDSFTRMNQERTNEQKKNSDDYLKSIQALQKVKEERDDVKKALYALFSENNAQKRGKLLEAVLNRYFKTYNILVKEDFKRVGEHSEGILEQIDGVIEHGGKLYLVEMKWTKDPISANEINAHLIRIYHRSHVQGIFISASGYTASGLESAKEALIRNTLIVLFDLEEFVKIIDSETDFNSYVGKKVNEAILNKKAYIKLI
jgi:restriction endonuclease Mrr